MNAAAGGNTVTFMKRLLILPVFVLSGCDTPFFEGWEIPAATPVVAITEVPVETLDPTPPPPPPPTARTVEQFDTTTQEDRAAAVAVVEPAGEQGLGVTIATLGPPAEPGIWIKTPLVSDIAMGRAEYGANGKTVNLELRPSGGEAGSGSQISLAAMRLLDIPLTALAEVSLFK